MEEVASESAYILLNRLKQTPENQRLLVGLSGIPASGKTTFAKRLVSNLNSISRVQRYAETRDPTFLSSPPSTTPPLEANKSAHDQTVEADIALLVGLDGWHFSRSRLDTFPDPKLAHDRRGAHWTFDGQAYGDFVEALRIPITATDSSDTKKIYAPSFDHAVKDPIVDAVAVLPQHRIIIIEGLYSFLGIDPWRSAAEALDERWFFEIAEADAEKRLVARHLLTGVAKDHAEAVWRSENNDRPNGRFIMQNMLKPTRRIQNIDDASFAR